MNSLKMGPAAPGRAAQADAAGADELADPVRANELLERVELLGLADQLEDDAVGPDVRDPGVEDVRERHQLGAPLRRGGDRDQRELALDRIPGLELPHAQDVDELVHLLLDLLERLLVAVDAQRDRGDVCPLRRSDRETLDVETPAREQLADAHERAGLVLDEHAQRVDHATLTGSTGAGSSYSTMSSAAAPAGIIGKQCSTGSTRASTTAV